MNLKRVFRNVSLSFLNNFTTYLPSNKLRLFLLSNIYKMKIGKNVKIAPGVKYISPWKIKIGNNTIINSSSLLDGRGSIEIGNNVDIAWFCKLISYRHNYDSNNYEAYGQKIIINDYCCLAVDCMILPGVIIPEGCVIGARSIVSKSLEYSKSIYVGSPVKKIRKRNSDLKYKLLLRSIKI